MKLITALLCAFALTGCATDQYKAYADAHKAQAAAQTARYQALADIARQGDTTVGVAAVMALQMGGGDLHPGQGLPGAPGLGNGADRWFQGSLSQLLYYNVELTAQQIKQNFFANANRFNLGIA